MIFIVNSFGFLLLPYRIAFTDDGGNADILASLFMVIFLSPHSCNILFLTAVTVSTVATSIIVSTIIGYEIFIENIGNV